MSEVLSKNPSNRPSDEVTNTSPTDRTSPKKNDQGSKESDGRMTRAMRAVRRNTPSKGAPRLRVGFIQGGVIRREVLLEPKASLTIGPTAQATFCLPDHPRTQTLFRATSAGYELAPLDGLEGRINHGGNDETANGSGPLSLSEAPLGPISLQVGARGRVHLDEVSFLFEVLTVERAPVTVQSLPPTRAAIDWLFTSFVAASFLLFFGFVVYMENADWVVSHTPFTPDGLAARLVFDEPTPPPAPLDVETPEVETPEAPDAADPTDDVSIADTTVPGRSDTPRRPRPAEDATPSFSSADVADAVHRHLGALTGEDSAFQDLLASGAPATDAADLMANVAGVDHARRTLDPLTPRVSAEGSGQQDDLGTLVRGPSAMAVRPSSMIRERRIPPVRVQPPHEDWLPNGTPIDAISRIIRRSRSAIQRCYEHVLVGDPGAAGRVQMTFTVTRRGTFTAFEAEENNTGSDRVPDCISRAIGRHRVIPVPEQAAEVSFTFVFSPSH